MSAVPFISVCSGIEAASEAWNPLGMQAVLLSEIEAAPRAVLEFRHAARDARLSNTNGGGLPMWGDFSALRVRHLVRLGVELPEILVGGTPCQSFSIAGLRKSLGDARGNLTFAFVRLANAIDNARRRLGLPGLIIVWENVPGVLSTKDNAFGCFLAGLVGANAPIVPGAGQRWTRAGMVAGPVRRTAWIVKDAQYFGLAQRRERVFAVSCPLDGPDPSEILFEPEGMRRHFAPSRSQGKDVAGAIAKSSFCGGAGGRPEGAAGNHFVSTLDGEDVSKCLSASHTASGRQDPSAETYITHTLRGEGFDASEDGTGRGIPLIAHSLRAQENASHRGDSDTYVVATLDASYGKLQGCSGQDLNHGHSHLIPSEAFAIQERAVSENIGSGPGGKGYQEGISYTLEARTHVQAVAYRTAGDGAAYDEGDCTAPLTTNTDPSANIIGFSSKDHGADATADLAPTMRAMGHSKSHANAGGQLAVAFNLRGREGGAMAEMAEMASLRAASGGSSRSYVVHSSVRRLMPPECETLQGFRQGYTLVPYRNGWMADGPRYRMLGNSMAVPCMAWIGRRILEVRALHYARRLAA